MIEIVPELWPYGHCSSPNFSFFVQNLDYKPQSINLIICFGIKITETICNQIYNNSIFVDFQ